MYTVEKVDMLESQQMAINCVARLYVRGEGAVMEEPLDLIGSDEESDDPIYLSLLAEFDECGRPRSQSRPSLASKVGKV